MDTLSSSVNMSLPTSNLPLQLPDLPPEARLEYKKNMSLQQELIDENEKMLVLYSLNIRLSYVI